MQHQNPIAPDGSALTGSRGGLRHALGAAALAALAACRGASASPDQALDVPTISSSAQSCGGADQPECPTSRWMKSTMQAYLRTRDFERLQSSFDTLAARAPEGYAGWAGIARDGAKAAAAGDAAGVQKSCQTCHDRHRAPFRLRDRARELL